ncbi:lysozyme inhibitor LprI family protein [Pseudooceanicola sp.]|uniref:lysozyme inhibitor LprI family protein n=1 Tax=Pseudooceanicola sp. TaxID=1914328 RepID=UPI004057D0ED
MRHSFIGFLLLTAPASAATPSFDCSRAGTPTEYAICDNDELARLDVALADAYRAARDRPGVRDRQRAWIKERNLCGANVACLAQRMRERLAELTGGTAPGGTMPPVATPTPPGSGGAMPPVAAPTPPGGGITPPGGARPAPGGPGLTLPGGGGAGIAMSAADATGRAGAYCPDSATGFGFSASGDTATFSYATFLANGHACGTGTLTARREGAAWVSRKEGCTLVLTLEETGFHLETATVAECQRLYCGARAMITEADIPYSSRAPSVPDPTRWNFMEDGC